MKHLFATISKHTAGSYILSGPKQSGKRVAALQVTEQLGLKSSDPDFIYIKPNDKQAITIEMAHDLVDRVVKRPFSVSGQRVVIIERAEALTLQAQNALLKLIEEPPQGTYILLLVRNSKGLLPTIRSRCQTIFMNAGVRPLPAVTSIAKKIIDSNTFERILMVEELSKQPELANITMVLASELSKQVRQQKATSHSLQTMQNYFIYADAGVGSKQALMELMIRL